MPRPVGRKAGRMTQPDMVSAVGSLFSGKVAVVTGASSGIGAATARLLAAHGAAVAINYLSGEERAKAVVAAIEAAQGRAIAVRADVTDPHQVRELVVTTESQLGPVDVLVANAHGVSREPRIAPVVELEWSDVESPVSDQLKAVFHPVKAVLPGMLSRERGSIVVVGASLSRHPVAGFLPIAAAKATVEVVVKTLARELGQHGIRVNGVAPGLILSAIGERVPADRRISAANRAALRRNGMPADVAQAIVFLAAETAGYLTGSYVVVDGGTNMT